MGSYSLSLPAIKTWNIDQVNIVLIILTAIIAFFLPFQTFLFAYAVLGPLHYLTEISWLEERNYFMAPKLSEEHLRLLLGLVLFGSLFIRILESQLQLFVIWVIFCSFGLLTNKMLATKWYAWLFVFVTGWLVSGSSVVLVVMVILLPTIVHVLAFTFLFMLYGTLNSQSKYGVIALGVYLLTIVLLVIITYPELFSGGASSYVVDAYNAFAQVNLEVMNLLNINNPDVHNAIYESQAGLSIMRVISFAYTYHYLNWFSKTSVIGWHRVGRTKIIVTIVLWVLSVGLYLVNYRIGLLFLFGLSFAHVVLEFPLNHLTMQRLVKPLMPSTK